MPALLARLLTVALVLAAVDSVHVRLEHPWRVTAPALYLQAVLLWGVFAALAAAPAAWTVRLLRRGDSTPVDALRATLVLGAWAALPVAAHAALDRHTGLAGLAGLKAVRPWLEALGVALVGAALVAGLDRGLRWPPLRRVRWPALAAVVLAGLFLPWHRVPGGGARTAAAAGAERPNLLLLVWDTTRADRLVPYGYDRETTPHLARFAEQALVFEDSLSVARFTLTSHVSLLTGLAPSTHGTRLSYLRFDRRRAVSVAELLHRQGYRTGAFVGTDVLSGRTGVRSGFEVYDDQVDPPVCDTLAWSLVHDVQALLASLVPALRNNGLPHWIQDFQRPAEPVLARALEWIERDDARPWFCMVNLYDVHWPYLPAAAEREVLVRAYDGPMDGYLFRSDRWEKGYEIREEDRRHLSDLYDAELLELDRKVDAFLGALALERGDTAVVLTSDHGEAFGEGGLWKHEDVLEPQVRVPLLIRPPGRAPEGRRVDAPVYALDVAPTLLGLAGAPVPDGLPGVDLLAEVPDPDRRRLVEDRDHLDPLDVRVALYADDFKLVRRGFDDEATYTLHDLERDPLGLADVAAEHPDRFRALVEELSELRRLGDARDRASEEFAGSAEGLRALGYVGGDDEE